MRRRTVTILATQLILAATWMVKAPIALASDEAQTSAPAPSPTTIVPAPASTAVKPRDSTEKPPETAARPQLKMAAETERLPSSPEGSNNALQPKSNLHGGFVAGPADGALGY